MDVEWVVLLLKHKFQAFLLDGDQAAITNPTWKNQVQVARGKLDLVHQSLKDSRNEEQMGRLLPIFYSAEDAIDTFLARTLLQRQKLSAGSGVMCQPFKGFKDLWVRFLFTAQIKKFMSQIEDVGCHSSSSTSSSQNVGHQGKRRASVSYLDADREFVGLVDQAKELEERLVPANENNQATTEVILVEGEGGLGKTTLAKIVYEKVRIKRHFKNCIWVNVSNYLFSCRDVVFNMLKQVDQIAAELEESFLEQELVSRLSEVLIRERYLVVLDDVGEPEIWERLRIALPSSDNGSRIVLTTRNSDVAAFASSILKPGRLNTEESWELFLKKVCIAEDSSSKNLDLVAFKEQILKLCGGLPLAIILMGSLSSMIESSHSEWSRVIEDANCLNGDVISLCYQQLPARIRPCFLYLGSSQKGLRFL